MSASLGKNLRPELKRRAVPVHKGDEVSIVRGSFKGRSGKVLACVRKKFVLHIENITREKANGSSVPVGIHPSNTVITKLFMDKHRLKSLTPKKN